MHLARDLICLTAEEAEFLVFCAGQTSEYTEKFRQEALINKLNEAIKAIRKDRFDRGKR